MRRVGIDMGGTNTDAVGLDGVAVLHAVKTPTTPDVTGGITTVLRELLAGVGGTTGPIHAVMIGTTHFTQKQRDPAARPHARGGGPHRPAGERLAAAPQSPRPEDLATLVRGEVVMLGST